MSGFSTFNTAITGLAAAQRSLDATSQNIVNANTPGYSRQRVLLKSVGATSSATFHTGQNEQFGGVRVSDVSRIRDAFLEAARASAGGRQSSLDAQIEILDGSELLLAEPGDNGLQQTLDDFYGKWHDLEGDASNPTAGAVIIQKGIAVADQLTSVSTGLASQWGLARTNLEDVVARTNQAAADLAKLNGSIRAAQTAGKPVNELLDTRDQLVRNLASYVGGFATTDDEGQISVSVNGITIVSGTDWHRMSVTGSHDISTATTDPPGLEVGGYPVPVEYGEAAGLLATLRTDLPSLSASLDAVAKALITAVNTVYLTGYDHDGVTGQPFFGGTDARTITVVPTDGGNLAIASAAGITDASVGSKVGDLADDEICRSVLAGAGIGGDGPSVQWRNLTTSLGVHLQSLKTAQSVQSSVVAASEDAVQSDAGVNLDEEMTNMMLFQRAYQASARAITTADEMLDTLINRTGRVGL